MSSVALLNPQHDAALARELLDVVSEHLARTERKLIATVLDREGYLSTIGSAIALRAALDEMTVVYQRRLNT